MPVKKQYRTLSLTKREALYTPGGVRSTLQWVAPTLARVGLIKNESWIEEHATLAESYYTEMRAEAVSLASCHPLALQYLQQAPILVLSHRHGVKNVAGLIETVRRFQELVSQRPKLRDLMEAFKIPYVLRDLSCPYVEREDIYIVDKLYRGIQEGYINPSTVKQSLRAGEQYPTSYWLAAISNFASTLNGHLPENFFSYLNWHLKNWGQQRYDGVPGVGHVADFIDANPRLFNPNWSARRMLEEAHNWLNRLNTEQAAEQAAFEAQSPKDYSPWPNEPTKIGEYTFMPLRSSSALGMEGRLMHHCVASYARRVYAGYCRIYSVRRDDYSLPLATVEFRLSGRVNQIRGMCNAAPPDEILAPMVEFQRICEERERGKEVHDACAVQV